MRFNIQNPAFLQMGGRSGKGTGLFYVASHVDENEITFANTKLGAFADNIQYSTDNAETWNQLTADTVITLGEAETVYFRNYTKEVYSAAMGTKILKTSDLYSIGGNISALFYPSGELPANAFKEAFLEDTNLISASALTLPATTLAESCYRGMFSECTRLKDAPTLPATTLAESCYSEMFYDCEGLTAAPTLPATTMAIACYSAMFSGCTGLTAAPTLPATTLAGSCYSEMFSYCTGLTAAPTLPATTLAEFCYGAMFSGCTGLTAAPILPATTLSKTCYASMLAGCTGLTEITCLASSGIENATSNWLLNVAESGTFTKAADMEDWPEGASGIPTGWTVQDYVG